MDRRTFLVRVGALATTGALAGCSGTTRQGPIPATPLPDNESVSSIGSTTPAAADTPTDDETGTPGSTPTSSPQGRDRPVIFVRPAEVEAIRAKVDAGEEPWKSAHARLVEDADRALNANPKSVTDNGAPANADDPSKYGTDAPYQGRDGVFSEDINRHDYDIALAMKDWIRDTAQAYAFTRKDEYARKSIDLLHHWFVDSETGMYPSVKNFGPHTEGLKGQNSIEHYIFVPAMFYGAALVSGHPYWGQKENSEADLREWAKTFQESLETGPHGGGTGDEIYKWWTTTRALVAAFLGDEAGMKSAFEEWRTTALKDFADRGTFEAERGRTRGLYYSLSAQNALILCAEIARNHGVNLYEYTGDWDEPVLRKAFDYHVQYVLDPTEWPWQEREGLDRNEREYGLAGYELAYAYYRDERYLEALQKLGRPIYDQRVTGWVTLTHGNRFALDVPPVASETTITPSGTSTSSGTSTPSGTSTAGPR